METEFKVHLGSESPSEVLSFLNGEIKAYNDQRSPFHSLTRDTRHITHLAVSVKQENGEFIAALAGRLYWEWLNIEELFVAENYRRQGIGRSLLAEAERIAVDHQCRNAVVRTFSFQAREFYEDRDFRLVGTLEDYPPGSALYWMRKNLG